MRVQQVCCDTCTIYQCTRKGTIINLRATAGGRTLFQKGIFSPRGQFFFIPVVGCLCGVRRSCLFGRTFFCRGFRFFRSVRFYGAFRFFGLFFLFCVFFRFYDNAPPFSCKAFKISESARSAFCPTASSLKR